MTDQDDEPPSLRAQLLALKGKPLPPRPVTKPGCSPWFLLVVLILIGGAVLLAAKTHDDRQARVRAAAAPRTP